MRKKPKIKYTEMAMYVDEHIHDKNADVQKIYDYLVMLAYMLSVKRRFFNKESYYDMYANYLATIVYTRITNPRQFLSKDDPQYLTPIKSCLNYMKQILYARKCAFCAEEFEYTTKDESAESEAFKAYAKSNVLSSNTSLLVCDIELYFSTIDRIIKDYVYNGVYAKDKVLCWKLYTSCLISLLRNFTLSNKNKIKLIDIKKTKEQWQKIKEQEKANKNLPISEQIKPDKKRIFYKTNYYELMDSFMADENRTAPIVYDLSEEYLDYVALTIQKIKVSIINDIREMSHAYDLSDEMVEDILMSGLVTSEDD